MGLKSKIGSVDPVFIVCVCIFIIAEITIYFQNKREAETKNIVSQSQYIRHNTNVVYGGGDKK